MVSFSRGFWKDLQNSSRSFREALLKAYDIFFPEDSGTLFQRLLGKSFRGFWEALPEASRKLFLKFLKSSSRSLWESLPEASRKLFQRLLGSFRKALRKAFGNIFQKLLESSSKAFWQLFQRLLGSDPKGFWDILLKAFKRLWKALPEACGKLFTLRFLRSSSKGLREALSEASVWFI